jgi:hypothetical protein
MAGFPKPWEGRFPRLKKLTGKPVEPAGSPRVKNIRHTLGWEPDRFMYRTGPVPPGIGRTGPVPTGFSEPWLMVGSDLLKKLLADG